MAGSRLTVLHTSDWQCGRPFRTRAAEALLRLVPRIDPDVAIVSGDLTQRAKAREFRTALEWLRELSVPVVTTPGNHDVPLYRLWERLFAPFSQWRRFISVGLDTIVRAPGATFVALNSAAPRRAIVNGRLDERQMDFAARAFDDGPAHDLRCLVVHHHFVPVASGKGGPPLPQARRWLERIEAMGVDAVFGGHVHQTHLFTSRDVLPGDGPGVPVLACGTTLSRRGRGREAGWNSLNVVRLTDDSIDVTPHLLPPDGEEFQEAESRSFRRPHAGREREVGVEEER